MHFRQVLIENNEVEMRRRLVSPAFRGQQQLPSLFAIRKAANCCWQRGQGETAPDQFGMGVIILNQQDLVAV